MGVGVANINLPKIFLSGGEIIIARDPDFIQNTVQVLEMLHFFTPCKQ